MRCVQDAFGNYVVQYVLELGQADASRACIRMLAGHLAELSMQKFSSNVVEKCLKLGGVVSEGYEYLVVLIMARACGRDIMLLQHHSASYDSDHCCVL
jgi:hypothetical protein